MPDFAVGTAFTAAWGGMKVAFRGMIKGFDQVGRAGGRAMMKLNKGINKLGNKMFGAVKGFLPALGLAGFAMQIGKGIELASDLTEVQNVVDTTFKENAGTINDWSRTAITAFGISELQAKQFTGSLGAMMKSSGLAGDQIVKMSTDLSGLAGDFASFYNLKIEDSFDKIRSGISGETEPLKRLGINMSVTNMQAFALSQGITKAWKSMTQAEQTTLRYNYLMKVSKDAQGDFAKTLATSYANQKRVLGVQFDQFLARIMTKILPKITELFGQMNDYISKIDTDKIAVWVERIATALPYLVEGFIGLKVAMLAYYGIQKMNMALGWIQHTYTLIKATKGATFAQKALNFAMKMNPIGVIIVAVAALAAGIIYLVKNWDELKASMQKTDWGNAILAVLGAIGKAIDALKWSFSELKKEFDARVKGPEAQKKLADERMKNWFGVDPKKTDQIEESILPAFTAFRKMVAPNAGSQKQQIDFNGNIDVNAPQGTTVNSKTRGAKKINMQLVGQN